MTIYRCDLCGKDISTANDVVKVGYHSYGFLASEFCADCGKPVVRFLTRVEKKRKGRKRAPCCGYYLKKRMKRLEDAVTL